MDQSHRFPPLRAAVIGGPGWTEYAATRLGALERAMERAKAAAHAPGCPPEHYHVCVLIFNVLGGEGEALARGDVAWTPYAALEVGQC